jgi:hypothetical protein
MITTLSKPDPKTKARIVLDKSGKQLGTIEFSTFTERWFAKFPLGTDSSPFAMGHGNTPEEAAANAIDQTRKDLTKGQNKLKKIEEALHAKSTNK